MDVLSDILTALRLKGTLYFWTESTVPWGLRVPQHGRVARFHLVARGGCWIRVTTIPEPIRLEAGDVILIPDGAEHVIADTPDTPCRTVEEVVKAAGFTGRGALVFGGPDTGAPTRLVCGHFEFDDGLFHPLLTQLPPALVIRWDDAARRYPFEDAFHFIIREVQEGRPGHEAVVARLSEVLFVQMIRYWATHSTHERGVLAALSDPRLGAALASMHTNPAERWSLDKLSKTAAMGRTAFAERFGEVLGETPLKYLTRWRVQTAMRLLAETHLSIEQIAEQVGYETAASFSRAFKKTTGVNPGGYRKRTSRLAS